MAPQLLEDIGAAPGCRSRRASHCPHDAAPGAAASGAPFCGASTPKHDAWGALTTNRLPPLPCLAQSASEWVHSLAAARPPHPPCTPWGCWWSLSTVGDGGRCPWSGAHRVGLGYTPNAECRMVQINNPAMRNKPWPQPLEQLSVVPSCNSQLLPLPGQPFLQEPPSPAEMQPFPPPSLRTLPTAFHRQNN